jgi:hypothetical protein
VRPFGVAIGVAKRKVIEITGKYTVKSKSSFLLATFLRGSGTKSTGVFNFPCLKEPNKIKNEVCFYVFMKTSSKTMVFFDQTMVFFDHQNKCRLDLRVELSSL